MKAFKINKFYAVATLAACLLFTACSSEEQATNETTPVLFSASMQKATVPVATAANGSWAVNDAIGIFMLDNATTNISSGAANKQHQTSNAITFTPVSGNAIYYPASGSRVDFVAYYPHVGSIGAGGVYNINLLDQSAQAAIDLLWAKADNTGAGYNKATTGNINLNFSHKLSKIIVKPVAGNGLTAADLASLSVSITGMNTTASFNVLTGVINNDAGTPTAISPATVTAGSEYEAIILPYTYAANAISMTFALNNASNDVFTWVNDAPSGVFEPGRVHLHYDYFAYRRGLYMYYYRLGEG